MAKASANKNKTSDQSSEKINHYDINEILDGFNLKRTKSCQTLTDWLQTIPSAFSLAEQEYLELLPQELIEWQYTWNEEELKMNFISLVLRMAHLNEPQKIGLYYERSLSGKVMNKSISVVVDCMVATPKNSGRPDMPYFFMQEFKRTKGDSHDPEGQMLAAMLLAQEMNKDEKAIYGCWLQGKNWNFTTLVGNVYCVSKQFDATQKADLQEIIFILRKLKDLILRR